MPDPIPLTDPSGEVRAYACGACLNVLSGTETLGVMDADARARSAEMSREAAERCCTCSSCGAPVADRLTSHCPACAEGERERWAIIEAQQEESQRAEVLAREASLEAAKSIVDARILRLRMEGLSEACWCAGWIKNLGQLLWTRAKDESDAEVPTGFGHLTGGDRESLRILRERAGGWWHWPKGAAGPLFITLEQAEEVFDA